MNKLIKITIWKDLIALLVVLIVISCIFIFNIKVGFSVFQNIKFINILLLLIVFLSVLTIVFVITIIIYIKRKRKNKE